MAYMPNNMNYKDMAKRLDNILNNTITDKKWSRELWELQNSQPD